MSAYRGYIFLFTLIIFSVPATARPPNQQAAIVPAPQVYSVIVDYSNSKILVNGLNLDSNPMVNLAGVDVTSDLGTITNNQLEILFSSNVSTTVASSGNYVLIITTDGGNFTVSAFIPFPLVYFPPSNDPCPCQGDWDQFRTQAPPNGFSGLAPYCYEDDGTGFVTVQFWDTINQNYWVLETDWNGSSGSCALVIDGPTRTLDGQTQFDACASYLRTNYIQVYPDPGNTCLY